MALRATMFREYDIRGRVPEIFPDATDELSDEGMRTLGRAFGTLAKERGRDAAVVGHDLRTYSARLKDRFVEGIAETGLVVRDVGCVLTPTLYFSQIHLKTPAGAMITASHNPQGWSGLKLSLDYVTTLLQPDIARLRQIAEKGPLARGRGRVEVVDVRDAYVADLVARVRITRPLRVVLDAGNGTASYFCVDAYRRAGLEVVPLFCDPDPSFPNHFPNPSELSARRAIRAKVVETKADLGLSFDGDGDRLGVQDHQGEDVYPDRVLMLLARQVLARKPGASVVFDVKCTQALVEDIAAHGGKPVMWKTGHSWIKSKMKEVDAPIAGERSGHIFLREGFHGYDDGLYAGLRLAEYVSSTGRSLAALLAEAPRYVTSPEIHVDCADEVKYAVTERLVEEFRRDYPGRLIDINGARVSFDDGWGLVRPSSNLPELVLVFEGRTQAALDRIKAEFRRRLSRHPEIGTTWQNE